MKNRKAHIGILAFVGLMILVMDSKTACTGATEGLRICIQTIIPSLLPFFMLSAVITSSFSQQSIPLLGPIGRLLGIPKGSESILISAFLAGYPVGAQAVWTAFRGGRLTRSQAERMLGFCSNPGPSFLFGIAGSLFTDIRTVWLLWGMVILSSILVAGVIPQPAEAECSRILLKPIPFKPMESALKATATVCGWVILFRVLITFLRRWFLWSLPNQWQTIVIGLLELANGCCELNRIYGEGLRFLICGCLLSCGGICVCMQTISVIGTLRPTFYITGKLLQTLFTFILCGSILLRLWYVPVLAFCLIILKPLVKKSSSIPEKAIV